MGITNFINRVSNATQEIKEAITRKGVVVGECDSLEDMPDRIDEINTQGGSGAAVYTFLAFTSSTSKPSTPTGGSLTEDLTFTYPLGWSDGSSLSSDIWVTYADFTTDGIVKSWHAPVKVSGGSSTGSVDLTDYALKSWVLEQIKESINPGGIIDLSKYATKEYVDQKISELDPSGGTGIYVKSINGSTGEIKFQGDGVSQSGNTFTFAGGSGSGTTTSINGETGALTFTGSALTQSGKTFTFNSAAVDPKTGVTSVNDLKGDVTLAGSSTVSISKSGNTLTFTTSGGSGDGVSKDYVDEQDASTLKSAKDYADGLVKASGVTSLNGLKGAVKIIGGTSNVAIGTSDSGDISISVSGGSGGGGDDGDTYRSFNIYQNTDSNEVAPEISSGTAEPTWDTVNNKLLNVPSGWATDQVSEEGKYIWMTSATFSKKSGGSMVGDWEGPFCITGPDGIPGADGSDIEFIYALTKNEMIKPAYPSSETELKGLFDAAEGGESEEHYAEYGGTKWYDRAQSIDGENYKTCWMAQRVKRAGSSDWDFYSGTPVIWANWGSDGQDGDGVEYIFYTTDTAYKDDNGKWKCNDTNFTISYDKLGTVQGVSTAYDNTIDDWTPYGWLDEPADIDKNIAFFEFCAVRKKKDGVWQEFGTPALWSLAVNDGSDGSGYEQVFALYEYLVSDDNMSIDNASANADGAHTTDEYLPYFVFNGVRVQSTDDPQSVTSAVQYQYVSIRRKPRGINTEWGDFCAPRLYNNYTKATVDEETLQELKDTATNAAQESIENAVSDINTARNDIDNMRNALGYKDGVYKKLNEYDETNHTLTTQLGEVKTTAENSSATVSTFQQTIDGITQRVGNTEETTNKLDEKVTSLTTDVEGIRGQVTTLETWKNQGYKQDLKTAGFLTTDEAQSNFATKTNFDTVTNGLNKVTATMNQMSNIYGRYLMDSSGNYIDKNGYVIYTDQAGKNVYYEKNGTFYSKDSDTNEYTEATPASDCHPIGQGVNSDDEDTRKQAATEISTYGEIIAENIAAISTEVSEKASTVQLTAAVDGVKDSVASIAVNAAKNELSNITLTADRISFGSKTLADAVKIDSNTGKVLAGSLETKDNGKGSVTIVDDKVALCKDGDIVFQISGSAISSGGSSTTQNLSGSQIIGACSSSSDMSSQIQKELSLSYSWSKTVSLGSLSGVNGKLVVAPEEDFEIEFNPALDADQYLTSPTCGTLNVQVRRTIGSVAAGSVYKSFTLNYNGSQWRFLNSSGDEISRTFTLPSRTITCSSDSAEVSYIFEAWVSLTFDSAAESADLGANYDMGSKIYSVQNSGNRTFQILEQEYGTAVGTNGFKVALDGANRAQFVKSGSSISLILESSQYGVEVTNSNLWLKVDGKWYTPNVTSSGLAFTETTKS